MKTSLLSPRLLLVVAALLPQSLLAEGTGAHANDYDAGPAEELIAAVAAGNEAIVETLLADGALLVNAKDEWGWTALHEASNNGNVAIVEVLLAKETDVDAKDEFGQTPLHTASINGDAATVELLLAKGADVRAKDGMGRTALHVAASYSGDAATVELLLAKGADVDAKDKDGWTALHWASYNGDAATVEILLAKGADVHAKDEFGQTPLHRASINGDAATVELLLAAGADVHAKDEDGQTPRDVAASFFNTAAVEALDKALANPKAPGDRADEEGGHKDVLFPSALDAQREVAGWLRGLLPKLGKADAVRYRDHLIENGFDSTEAMALLEQGDLPFMKEGHKRLVAKQLVESQEILLRNLLNL